MVRLHYIDNLRWMCILLLFPLHAAFVFSAEWYDYYVSSGQPFAAAHLFIVSVEPWIMPLLFCIAGLSTKFALEKRTPRQYLKERVKRLLVPFLAGLVLICPVIAYYALKFHAGYTGDFAGAFVHFFSSVSGIADPGGVKGFLGDFSVDHLWFILALFVFSVVTVCMVLPGQRLAGLRPNPGSVPLPALGLLFIPLWLLNFVGISETGYSVLSYFAMFLTGYYLLALDSVQAQLERYWAHLVAAWIVLTIGGIWIYGIYLGHSEVFWGSSAVFVLAGWTGVLALMGAGKHMFDSAGPCEAYLRTASYPVYIIHQAILVALAYYVVTVPIPPELQFAAVVIFGLLLMFACYELLRRIPGVRALFGIAGTEKLT